MTACLPTPRERETMIEGWENAAEDAARLKRRQTSALADEQNAHAATQAYLESILAKVQDVVAAVVEQPSGHYCLAKEPLDALAEAAGIAVLWPVAADLVTA